MRKAMTLATIAVLMSVAGTAIGAEVEVKMLNNGAGEGRTRRYREIRGDRQGP